GQAPQTERGVRAGRDRLREEQRGDDCPTSGAWLDRQPPHPPNSRSIECCAGVTWARGIVCRKRNIAELRIGGGWEGARRPPSVAFATYRTGVFTIKTWFGRNRSV